ncbi:hypothetical protein DSO57_1008188 [Entomophthora muscae]|uniref:Uncharacterized protein n=1 Tax=Entomophthora muscae TaxID=34485 RepID=A0ACC2U5E2_9FUNG|nr:hypothetical protein DSO57_1008188 [Entomophthora muscae]
MPSNNSKRYCRIYTPGSLSQQSLASLASDPDDSDECPTPVSSTFSTLDKSTLKPKEHIPEPTSLTKGFYARKAETAADFERVLLFGFYNGQGKRKVCSTIKVSLSPPIISK